MIVDLHNKQYHKVMCGQVSKIAWLIYKEIDIDEHIQNNYFIIRTFFLIQKLVLCQGWKFAIPRHHIPAMDVQANFGKAY